MDAIGGVGSLTESIGGITADRLASGEDFLRILGAQLQAQDPLEPVAETEFLGQLAQFSQLEESIDMNQSLRNLGLLQDGLAAIQQMTQGSNLIGKTVEFVNPATGETESGEVSALRVQDGRVVLDIEGEAVPLSLLSAVLGES